MTTCSPTKSRPLWRMRRSPRPCKKCLMGSLLFSRMWLAGSISRLYINPRKNPIPRKRSREKSWIVKGKRLSGPLFGWWMPRSGRSRTLTVISLCVFRKTWWHLKSVLSGWRHNWYPSKTKPKSVLWWKKIIPCWKTWWLPVFSKRPRKVTRGLFPASLPNN